MSSQYFIELVFAPNEVIEDCGDIAIALLGTYPFDTFQNEQQLVKAYGTKDAFNDATISEIEALINPYGEVVAWNEIQKENWNTLWEKNYFDPITIGDFHVRAPFHPNVEDGKKCIEIIPKMSFGTGHHATTSTMLLCMQLYKERYNDAQVLDMGTGSGILAIASEFLGAEHTWGIEIDDWVVENAIENVSANDCSKIKISEGTAKLITDKSEEFDIVLANIHREVLIQDMACYAQALKNQGILFLSGIQQEDVQIINESANQNGMIKDLEKSKDGWFVLVYVKHAR